MSGTRIKKIFPKISGLDSPSMQNFMRRMVKEQDFLERIFNTIREALIVVDDLQHIVYYNAAAKNMLGIPDDISNLTFNRLLNGADFSSLFSIGSDGAYKVVRQELEINYPEHRIVQAYAQPLNVKYGNAQFLVILNDVTSTLEHAHTEAENERGKLISLLAGSVAHEIGNPLNSLYLHLQYLQRLLDHDDFDREAAAEELVEARSEVERLDGIINQFLRALRPGKLEFQPVDLKEMVLESLHFLQHEITSRQVVVKIVWPDSTPKVNGDLGQLKQAFYNLVRNALQAMQDGGELGIRCSADDDYVALSVSDTGMGIRKEDMSKLFEAYFTTKRTGTGLGLMIVDRIVREHGGSLSVSSDEGQGAEFTISLPLHEKRVKLLN